MKKLLVIFLLLTACGTSTSTTVFNYNKVDFDAAVNDEKDIFLNFFADWCPTCKVNEVTINTVLKQINNPDLEVFKVNYDTETELKKEFDIFLQSSYIYIENGDTQNFQTLGPGVISEKELFLILE